MENYRILTLDGGGSWALIEVMALIDLYGGNATGHGVLSDFDMVAANSGGSIVLGGLVEDMKLSDLLGFFLSQQKRESVFVEKWHVPNTPKYRTDAKLRGLEAALPQRGGWLMPEAVRDIPGKSSGKPVHLLIVGFDYDRNRARFFRSAAASGPGLGDGDPAQVRVVDAIHASSTAPVMYFDAPAELPSDVGKRYWDGAVTGGNNPVLDAVTEAMVLLHERPRPIVALSLGTGTVCRPPQPQGAPDSVLFATPYKQGLLADVEKLAGAIVDDPPDAASFLAHVMAGGPPGLAAPADSRIVRMNPMVSPMGGPGSWRLPDGMSEAGFKTLVNLAMDAVAQDDVLAIQNLASLWLQDKARNQPIRMDAALAAEVGHALYAQAKEAWALLGGAPPPPGGSGGVLQPEAVPA